MKEKKKKDRPAPDKDRDLIRRQWPRYTTAEKIKYIISYYGAAMAAILAAAGIAIFLIRDIRSQKAEEAVFIMAADTQISAESVASMQEELERKLSLDAKKQKCVLEASYSGNANRESEATMSAYMQSGRVDILIAPEETFNRYAATGYLMDLEEAIQLELFDGLDAAGAGEEDCFYASQVDYSQGGAVTELPYHPHEKTADSEWYGIYLTQGTLKGYVAGIMANCPHRESVKESLRYFVGF